MASITLTDANPGIDKATGGGGTEAAALTDTSPSVDKATGGGGHQHVLLFDRPPKVESPEAPTVAASPVSAYIFELLR